MQEQIESWIAVVRPWVEQEYGLLPEFVVKPGKIINETPWRIDPDYRKSEWVFRYYPGWFKGEWFQSRFPDQAGYEIYALVHDLLHLYQQKAVVRRFGYMKHLPKMVALFASLRFMEWAEGAAELCTWKTSFDRLKPEVTTNSFSSETLLRMFQTDAYKKPLADFLSQSFARKINKLAKVGLIHEVSLDALSLPYEVPTDIVASVALYTSGQKPLTLFGAKLQKPSGHDKGALRCARVVARTGISINELLRTPLTNKELKEQAGI